MGHAVSSAVRLQRPAPARVRGKREGRAASAAAGAACATSAWEIRQNGFAGLDLLTRAHAYPCAAWQIDVEPAPETDDAKTIAATYAFTFRQCAMDAPGHQTRNLYKGDIFLRPRVLCEREADRHPLVQLARLVEARIEEFAGPVSKLLDDPAGRNTVYMNIEDIHENRKLLLGIGAKTELGRGRGLRDGQQEAVGRAHDEVLAGRNAAVRIAEKEDGPDRQRKDDQARKRHKEPERRVNEDGDRDERQAVTVKFQNGPLSRSGARV